MTKTIQEKTYLKDLSRLEELFNSVPNTKMMAIGKVNALIMLNMRYEKIAFDQNLSEHPFKLVEKLLDDTANVMKGWRDIAFIEDPSTAAFTKFNKALEEGHEELFQKLWVNFSKEEYDDRIARYVHRLRINDLSGDWLKNKSCIDFGCGHGNFAHAIIREGAARVCGIDYGKGSIQYALKARDALGVSDKVIEFKQASVYEAPYEDNTFDFAIQNGVFHHLEDEDAAIREMHRVLKPGGWIWYYTDGGGGIGYDLWDASVRMLKDIPYDFIIPHLKSLHIETGKRYHLGDGLNAIYRHTSWEELTSRLSGLGFGEFKRMKGGFATDYDQEIIQKDKYGEAKFGEGDLRLLGQKKE